MHTAPIAPPLTPVIVEDPVLHKSDVRNASENPYIQFAIGPGPVQLRE
jgi:hypothetical protein